MTGSVATERLVLEPLRTEHASEMVAVLSDPTLYEFIGGQPPTLAELEARYEIQTRGRSPDGSEEWLNWIVRVAATGEAAGFVQATLTDDGADVAWLIGRPWQSNGYASEAAAALVAGLDRRGVIRTTAHVHPDHAASAAVAARIGLAPTDDFEHGERIWLRRSE